MGGALQRREQEGIVQAQETYGESEGSETINYI